LSLTSVHGCSHRTYCFTWGMITVLTHNRLKYNLRIVCGMFHFPKLAQRFSKTRHGVFLLDISCKGLFGRIISIDTQPVHIPVFSNLLFTNNWNVVLRMTGNNTGPTSGTCVQVNGHVEMVSNRTVESIPQIHIGRGYRSLNMVQ